VRVGSVVAVREAHGAAEAPIRALLGGPSTSLLGGRHMISRIGRWELDIDPVLTAECFARSNGPRCNCEGCRNFRALGENAFPIPFRALAAELGIDLSKPSELGHYSIGPGSLHDMHGWFHLVGSIRFGRDATRQVAENSWWADDEPLLGLPELGFTNRTALLPEAFKGLPIVQLDFRMGVPWVLDDSDSGAN